MRISYNWLKKYIDVKISIEQLAELLTSLGLEVESIEYLGKQFDNFVVGEIHDVKKHPSADRLSVCSVKISRTSGLHQIVCGASNVAAGQKVVVGLPGAIIPQSQHQKDAKPFVLSVTSIRGIESHGMLCSEFELVIGDDKNGIKVLEPSAKVGLPFAEYLGLNDIAFEIGITPNRPDCLSHLGVARDLAAALKTSYHKPKFKNPDTKKNQIKSLAKIKIENSKGCPRYTARIIQNVKVMESPDWMKHLLASVGLRSINNIVDATNFVMMEYGQPLHAFDYNALAHHTIVVKNASPGEKFTTLDGKEYLMDGSELMICDGEKSVAIAGVMGGANSEISSRTTTVLLESAYFDPASIRRAAKKFGISTDASYRFERGIDPNSVDEASARAAQLIAEISSGEVLNGCVDVYPKKIATKKINLRIERVNAILGTHLTPQEIVRILTSLEIKVQRKKQSFICSIPTFRPDIEQEIDVIEEIARHFGYDNISNQTTGDVAFSKKDKKESRLNNVRTWFEANGFNEIITNSLIDGAQASLISQNVVHVKNPLTVELECLRPSLLPTMLQSVAYNYNHGSSRLHFFEIGSVFATADSKNSTFVQGYSEKTIIGICMSGDANTLSWSEKLRPVDIYDIKGIVQSLLNGLGLDNIHLICYDASSSLTDLTLGVEINGTYVGFLGQCKKELLEKFKIDKDVFYAELDLGIISEFDYKKKFIEYSKFPTVQRDVAFIVNADIPEEEIEKVITTAGGKVVSTVKVFDVFSGKSVGEGKKSIAFSLNLNSFDRTLTDDEIEKIIYLIVQAVQSAFGAVLRSI